MSQSTSNGEKITAVVSTLVALIILAAGVTAQNHHRAPQDELVQLESDLRFQLDRAFRHDLPERDKRTAQLEVVLAAWKASPQSAADRDLLIDWLLEATIQSMPGMAKSLPNAPEFGVEPPSSTPKVAPKSEPIASIKRPHPIEDQHVFSEPDFEVAKVQAEPIPTPEKDRDIQPSLAASPRVGVEVEKVVPTAVTEEQPKIALRRTAFKPTATTATVKKPVDTVHINIHELSARIAGYHEGLDQVETSLLTQGATDLNALEALVNDLQSMIRNYQFVNLYYEALAPQERRGLAAPRSPRLTLLEIDRRIQNQQNVESGDFLSSFETSRVEKAKELRQRIATLARVTGK